MHKYLQILALPLFLLLGSAPPLLAIGELSPAFDQCEERIRHAHKDNVISYTEQQNLLTNVQELRARDNEYVAQHNPPISIGVRERTFKHDPSVLQEIQSIDSKLGFRTRPRPVPVAPVVNAIQRAWPPRDAVGKIIYGPRRFGTAEQMGQPLYGWSNEDRIKYIMQK
jgi:hypothetical protein